MTSRRPGHQDRANHNNTQEPIVTGASGGLEFLTLAELCAQVDAAGPRQYLIRGIWPAGAYGVHAAEMKAQKTWNAFDLAVSVASGTDWLGAIPIDDPGPVIIFAGEGGPQSIVRRLRAITASRDLKAENLPIHVCARAPHLSDLAHMAQFAERLHAVKPRLVILDPLYLAAGGADGKDLYAMGRLLERPQHLCEQVGAAIIVVTHFNRRDGNGPGRITGAGPAEWGRVLIGAEVLSRHTDPHTQATTVTVRLNIIGGDIPDQAFRLRRHIHADDPADLDSPLHYEVQILSDDTTDQDDSAPVADLKPAARKLLAALRALGTPATSKQLVDQIAATHGHGLRRETVSRTLNTLMADGHVDCLDPNAREKRWTLPEDDRRVTSGQITQRSDLRDITPDPTGQVTRSRVTVTSRVTSHDHTKGAA